MIDELKFIHHLKNIASATNSFLSPETSKEFYKAFSYLEEWQLKDIYREYKYAKSMPNLHEFHNYCKNRGWLKQTENTTKQVVCECGEAFWVDLNLLKEGKHVLCPKSYYKKCSKKYYLEDMAKNEYENYIKTNHIVDEAEIPF